jgi:hypothetical protein
MMIKKGGFWFICFSVILVIAILFLFNGAEAKLSIWGLPSWVFGFFIIEIIFCVAMWFFVQKFWQEDKTSNK